MNCVKTSKLHKSSSQLGMSSYGSGYPYLVVTINSLPPYPKPQMPLNPTRKYMNTNVFPSLCCHLSHLALCVTVTVFCRLQSPPVFSNPSAVGIFPDLYLSLLFILQVWNYSSHFANDQKLQLAFTALKGWLQRKMSLQGWWTLPSEKCSHFNCAVGSSVTGQYDSEDR